MGLLKVVNHRDSRVVLSRETRTVLSNEQKVRGEKPELRIEELVLESGANQIDAGVLEQFRKSAPAEQFFSVGMLTVEGEVAEGTQDELPKYGGDLSKLKVKAAQRTIAACNDPRQLKLWVQQDPRPEIRKALLDRHQEIMRDAHKPESEPSE